MAEMVVSDRGDGGINIIFTGPNAEAMRETERLREAFRAARQYFGKKVHQISGGGSQTGPTWELWWSFYPDGYRFPQRTG